jgi:hypothetical protein
MLPPGDDRMSERGMLPLAEVACKIDNSCAVSLP